MLSSWPLIQVLYISFVLTALIGLPPFCPTLLSHSFFASPHLHLVSRLLNRHSRHPWQGSPRVLHLFLQSLVQQALSLRLDVIVLSYYAFPFLLLVRLGFPSFPCHWWCPLFSWSQRLLSVLSLLTVHPLVSWSLFELRSL